MLETVHDIGAFGVAVFDHWHGYVSGGAVAFILEYGERLWGWKPSKKLVIVILAVGFGVSIFSAWRDQYRARVAAEKKIEELNHADAPYVLLRYLPVQGGPSGFMVSNNGKDTAIRIQINDIHAGNRIAKFGELPVLKLDGEHGIYPEEVDVVTDEQPRIANDLNYVFAALPSDEKRRSEITVTVDYWSPDNMRKFRTNCIFATIKESPAQT